ncbi:MAG: DUF3467 domain-containing protein [Candidatus Manganitrophaceae bacterium]|nr:MAG: DUF3467 domain-containing protein [Candidatus Manganitrophaceae bacterium]
MSNGQQSQPPVQVQVEIDDATSQGVYTNLALLTHSETEFVMDFIYIQPQAPKAKVRSRIITSPAHAKRFLAALQENIQRYEQRFGTIKVSGEPDKGNPYQGLYL